MYTKGNLAAIVLPPVADAFSGTVVSDYINMKHWQAVRFLVVKGVGTTGTSTITVLRASAANGTGAEAIPFKYRRIAADRTLGALTDATAAGFTTTAGSEDSYEIFVDTALEGMADSGAKTFVAVSAAEVVDSPVAGTIIAILEGARSGYLESVV